MRLTASNTAKDVPLALNECVLASWVSRENFVSDLGTEMTSEILQIFFKDFSIGHLRCAAFHPMSNGAVEEVQCLFEVQSENVNGSFPKFVG